MTNEQEEQKAALGDHLTGQDFYVLQLLAKIDNLNKTIKQYDTKTGELLQEFRNGQQKIDQLQQENKRLQEELEQLKGSQSIDDKETVEQTSESKKKGVREAVNHGG